MTQQVSRSWSNAFGTITCSPARVGAPPTEAELQEIVASPAADGSTVRTAGSGHSMTPIASTDGLLLDLGQMPRVARVDSASATASLSAGQVLGDVFDPLW